MKRLVKIGCSIVACFGVSTAAFAWGSDVSQSREIYRDTITVKSNDGKMGHAILVFSVSSTAYVGEEGNANYPDDRKCYYNDIRKTLTRSLSYVAPDGTNIPVRDTTIALPNDTGKRWGAVTPCNDKISEINNTLTSSTGSADSWQTYIDGQKADAEKIISQFGQVIKNKPETKAAMF